MALAPTSTVPRRSSSDMPILVMVEDLIFLSKIQQTAKLAGVVLENITPPNVVERLSAGEPASALICDLNYPGGLAIASIREIKQRLDLRPIPVIGFVSHVQADVAAEARAAGADEVMARSAFSQQLSRILTRYSAGTSGSE